MRLFNATLLILAILLLGVVNCKADRLYTWTDAKGVTHITQEPPPNTAKAVDTIDYPPQPNQPVRRPTANDQTNQLKGNLDQSGGQFGADSDNGLTAGDDAKEVQYEGDSYRRTLLRYEIKHKILDDHESGKDRPHPRKR